MGKVFTFQEIKRGHVPSLECFDVVRSEIAGELVANQQIVAASFCGSAAYKNQITVRSDIDVVCIFTGCSDQEIWESFRDLQVFAATKHVPLDLIPRHIDIFKTCLHDFGPGFVRHLRNLPATGKIKGDINLHISDLEIGLHDDLLGWLRQKVRSLQKYYGVYQFASHAEQCLYLEKTLTATIHFARRLLQLPAFSLQADDKSSVIKAYDEQIESNDLRQQFHALVQVSRDYGKELKFQLEMPDEGRYKKYVAEQSDTLLMVKDFLMQHAAFFV